MSRKKEGAVSRADLAAGGVVSPDAFTAIGCLLFTTDAAD